MTLNSIPVRWGIRAVVLLMGGLAPVLVAADVAQASGAAADATDIQSCVELADSVTVALQRALDPGRTAGEQAEARAEYERLVSLGDLVSMSNLGFWDGESESGRLCFEGELYRLLCSEPPPLGAVGTAGDDAIAGLLASCLPGVDYGADYTDEPFPSLAQFEGASSCEELGRFLAGVENEEFRRSAVPTSSPDGDDDFAAYWAALARVDEQGLEYELQCQGAAIEIARVAADQRCRAWIADGHGADKDPLTFNTRRCLGELLAADSSGGGPGTVLFFRIPMVLLASSPFTALISFRKGRRAQAWMGSAAIPAVGIVFGGAWVFLSGRDFDFAEGIAVGMMVLLAVVVVGGGLVIGSLVGAVGLAAPDSAWAAKWYDDEKMAAARIKQAQREGLQLPAPPASD